MLSDRDFDLERQRLLRRAFLTRSGLGLGATALGLLAGASVTDADAANGTNDQAARRIAFPNHAPRAKRVIFLYMSGGPSQFETFDFKPKLAELDGQPMSASVTAGQPIAQLQGAELNVLGPRFRFRRHGESGQEIADILPRTAEIADRICIVRSMTTDQINHDPAHTVMNTGSSISGRPSIGSWVIYGLGSDSEELPGFVVMTSQGGRNPQPIASRQWGAGPLPGRFQGVELRSQGEPLHYVRSPAGVATSQQRRLIEAIGALDAARIESAEDGEAATRIAQYELAFRMQSSVPALSDLSDESEATLREYGVERLDGSFAANCLMARRLVERGVRFVQLYHRGWDHHGDLVPYMEVCSRLCDGPAATLVRDLERRGLLDETLIVWGGEFGRTPMFQGKGAQPGRDHHIRCFSMWLAGGGIRGGTTYGASDELGYHAAENPVHVRDLHATMLHLLGIDHRRLTVRLQGLDWKLTGVEPARVIREWLA